jgi:hypothetical protein
MPQSQTYTLDISREPPQPVNDDNVGAGCCPRCKTPASTAPSVSEYRGKGVIHHHWVCHICGHEWITVLHVAE